MDDNFTTAVSGTDLPPDTSPPEKPFAWRETYRAQLADPRVRSLLHGYTNAEVGNQGAAAQQGFMESVLNRANAEGKSIPEILRTSYYPPVTHWRARQPLSEAQQGHYDDLADKVLGGSNVCNYCTGNASGTVGFAGGPLTARLGGEKLGIEGWTTNWARNQGYAGQLPVESEAPATSSPPAHGGGMLGMLRSAVASAQPSSGSPDTTAAPHPQFGMLDPSAALATRFADFGSGMGMLNAGQPEQLLPTPPPLPPLQPIPPHVGTAAAQMLRAQILARAMQPQQT